MKIKAFGMEIQVTEESVFVNGKEVYNKISDSATREIYKDWEENGLFIDTVDWKLKPKHQIDQAEQRMNVIGQNGNDGLHYQFWEQINTDLFNKDRLTDSNDPNDTTGIDY